MQVNEDVVLPVAELATKQVQTIEYSCERVHYVLFILVYLLFELL